MGGVRARGQGQQQSFLHSSVIVHLGHCCDKTSKTADGRKNLTLMDEQSGDASVCVCVCVCARVCACVRARVHKVNKTTGFGRRWGI